jgi:chitinase domain-containing protein 1
MIILAVDMEKLDRTRLPWVEVNLETYKNVPNFDLSKIMIGLNFYGMHSSAQSYPEAIIGPNFIQQLRDNHFKITWEETTKEHSFYCEETSTTIYYPTLQSIQERIELAKKHGVGLAVWETGQGLDYFYELF